MMINNKCLIDKPDLSKKYDEIMEKATHAHLDRCIADGRVTKDSLTQYLRSGAFTQFQARLHRNISMCRQTGKTLSTLELIKRINK